MPAEQAARAVHVRVTGQVQGVGFRAYAAGQARQHGVAGWARNEPDGSVEAWLEGSPPAVDALLADLRTGPPSAVVDDLTTRPVDPEGHESFQVG